VIVATVLGFRSAVARAMCRVRMGRQKNNRLQGRRGPALGTEYAGSMTPAELHARAAMRLRENHWQSPPE